MDVTTMMLMMTTMLMTVVTVTDMLIVNKGDDHDTDCYFVTKTDQTHNE